MRIGHGYDVHRFIDGDGLIVGGVKIPFNQSFLAHSDGDVLLHALCDALLGAAGMGDIGKHFPDSDEKYKDIDSRELLRLVVASLHKSDYRVVNVDMTIIAQSPKMSPHIDAMLQNIAVDLQVTPAQVNVKATTTEGLGFAGRKEGVAAHAVCLLESNGDG